jgi:hypothetical protein
VSSLIPLLSSSRYTWKKGVLDGAFDLLKEYPHVYFCVGELIIQFKKFFSDQNKAFAVDVVLLSCAVAKPMGCVVVQYVKDAITPHLLLFAENVRRIKESGGRCVEVWNLYVGAGWMLLDFATVIGRENSAERKEALGWVQREVVRERVEYAKHTASSDDITPFPPSPPSTRCSSSAPHDHRVLAFLQDSTAVTREKAERVVMEVIIMCRWNFVSRECKEVKSPVLNANHPQLEKTRKRDDMLTRFLWHSSFRQ